MSHAATLESIATARAHLDDLQAEIEAGARCAERLRADAGEIDSRVVTYIRQTARLHALVNCTDELRASIAEQRTILRDLRKSIDRLRQSFRRPK
jgi:predicted RNase H-like nuclease (RuvC/YqgF family)